MKLVDILEKVISRHFLAFWEKCEGKFNFLIYNFSYEHPKAKAGLNHYKILLSDHIYCFLMRYHKSLVKYQSRINQINK